MQEIATQVHDINSNVVAIVEASREQSTALGEINQAINTVDQGTQQNAAMVEEQTAASHGLAQEAAALFELLEQFKFDGAIPSATSSVRTAQSHVATLQTRLTRSAAPSITRGSSALAAKEASWEEF